MRPFALAFPRRRQGERRRPAALRIELLEDRSQPSGSTLTQSAAFPDAVTNWARLGTAERFDPALGTLTKVEVVGAVSFTSRMRVESLDSSATTIAARTGGTLTVAGPSVLLAAAPAAEESFGADVFDGTIDFGGSSGHDFGFLTAAESVSIELTGPEDLARYTGTGSLSFTASAQADSRVAGSGNLVSHVATTAGGEVRLVYHYTPADRPEPEPVEFIVGRQTDGFSDAEEGGAVPQAGPHPVAPDARSPVDNRLAIGSPVPSADTGSSPLLVALLAGPSSAPAIRGADPDTPDGTALRAASGPDRVRPDEGLDFSPGGSDEEAAADGLASLSGHVFRDDNDNGRIDRGEPGIAGVAVVLTGVTDRGRPVTRMTATDDLGFYSFDRLPPGTYLVTEVQPRGFLDGKRQVGTVNGQPEGRLLADDAIADIQLPSLGHGINYNFGELPPPDPTGRASPPEGPLALGAILALTGCDQARRSSERADSRKERMVR